MTPLPKNGKSSRRLILLHLTVFSGLFLGALFLPRGPFVLVVTDPRLPPDHIMHVIGNADGAFVLAGASPWVAVAYSEKADFPGRLRDAGAILVLNHILAAGCQAGA